MKRKKSAMNKKCFIDAICILTFATFSSGGLINKGVVTDTISSEPVSGVLVQVSGTNITGTTDAQGKFSLSATTALIGRSRDIGRVLTISFQMRGSGKLFWQAKEAMSVKLYT